MALFNYECDDTKRIIDEVSPNYPQLTTYEKEWLFFHKYHYIPSIPDELEYQKVNVNPYGSVANAIPYQYKSAILKGNTLVNIANIIGYNTSLPNWRHICLENTLTPNTKYFLKMYGKPTNTQVVLTHTSDLNNDGSNFTEYTTSDTYIFTTPPTMGTYLKLHINDGGVSESITVEQLEKVGVLIVKYQDEMENQDIPYFEGMQSVEMPVLTTSNEDGTKTNILTVNEDITLRSNGDVYDELNLLTGRLTQRIDENNEVLAQEVVKTVDLNPLTKPYEGTNYYHLTANIPCDAIIEVPVVSTGEQTLEEINN